MRIIQVGYSVLYGSLYAYNALCTFRSGWLLEMVLVHGPRCSTPQMPRAVARGRHSGCRLPAPPSRKQICKPNVSGEALRAVFGLLAAGALALLNPLPAAHDPPVRFDLSSSSRSAVFSHTSRLEQMEQANSVAWRAHAGLSSAGSVVANNPVRTARFSTAVVALPEFRCEIGPVVRCCARGTVGGGEGAGTCAQPSGTSNSLVVQNQQQNQYTCHLCSFRTATRHGLDVHMGTCYPSHDGLLDMDLSHPCGDPGTECQPCEPPDGSDLYLENTRAAVGGILTDYKYTHFVPVATIQRFVDDTRSLLTQHAVPELARRLNEHPAIQVDSSVDLTAIAKACVDIFAGHETDLKRDAWLKETVDHVPPTVRELGKRTLCATSDEGFQYGRPRVVTDTCVDIPIPETLSRLLQYDPRAWQLVRDTYAEWSTNPPKHGSSTTIYGDIHDGAVVQNHPELGQHADMSDGACRIGIILSYDGVTMVNALGATASQHNIGIISYAIANLPAALRMSLHYIQVACVFYAPDMKRYGADAIMSGSKGAGGSSPGAGLRLLDQGMSVELPCATDTGVQRLPVSIRAWCICLAGDFPAIASLVGSKGSVSAHCFCRECNLNAEHDGYGLPNSFMHANTQFAHRYTPRDLATHHQQYRHWLGISTAAARDKYLTSIGVTTFYHGFMRVPHFNICTMCPQDVMHTVYEGLGKLEMAAMIYMFVTNRLYFTLSQLNAWMRIYDWGNDRRPPDITESVTKGTREKTPHAACHVHMTAGQVKTFIAHSEMLLTPLLASAGGLDDIVWQCWLAFARAVSFMERPSFSFDDVLQLDRYIYYHQTRFVRIPEYASLWKPPSITS